VTPRETALSLLREVERGRRLDVAWEAAAPALPPADRWWVQELVYGVIRFRGRLDHLLGLHLHRGVDSVPPDVLNLLRMGAWQILSMGSVPDYAAVSETVDQVRAGGGSGLAGLVNAVLRRLAEAGGGPERFPSPDVDPTAYLCTWGSHPRWLVERWIERFGVEDATALVEANNRIPRVHLRRLDTGEGVPLDPGADVIHALRVSHPAIVQDPAASAVVDFAAGGAGGGGLADGERVADLCAAPGGKLLGLAGLGASRGMQAFGFDRSAGRLRRVRENAERVGFDTGLAVALGEAPPLGAGSMDRVLVDAPCTGTGTLARHPDARWRLDPGSIRALVVVQDRILDGAAGIVRPGGILIYSTCSLEVEENLGRVEAFLRRHPEFQDEATMEVLPQRSGTDGAFAARLRRDGNQGDRT
jgi:16S rRNA (cytosine967-C5)-methyltransferase